VSIIEDSTVQFLATAYLANNLVAPGVTFGWESGDTSVVEIDAASGLAIGMFSAGQATVTATVNGCSLTCTATVENLGSAPTDNLTVYVIDELEGTPIEGATVDLVFLTDSTNVDGMVTFATDPTTIPVDITVSKQDYAYATLRQVGTNSVVVHLTRVYNWDYSGNNPVRMDGGIRGSLNYDAAGCVEPNTVCDAWIGLGGISMPGNLVNLTVDLLIGSMINTEIEFMGFPFTLPLPAGLVMCIQGECFKEFYSPTGIPGRRIAWSVGGKQDMATLIEKLAPIFAGGNADITGSMVVDILSATHSGLLPNVLVEAIPHVADVDNIDGNPNTTTVPDYDNFPVHDMALTVPMDNQMTFSVPQLPANPDGGYYYDEVIVLAGVLVPGAGLVPLGIGANSDSDGDGMIDADIPVIIADVADRIPEDQVERVIVALALAKSNFDTTSTKPTLICGQVIFPEGNAFQGNVMLDTFMTPAKVYFNYNGRYLESLSIPADTDYVQTKLVDEGYNDWSILGEWAVGTYGIPSAPPEGDREWPVSYTAIDLVDGLSFADIAEFNDTNMADLVRLVKAFVMTSIPPCWENAHCPMGYSCVDNRCVN
jgi:hypothetical protein